MVAGRGACDHPAVSTATTSPFARRRDGRWLGGVCAGLGPAVGIPAGATRALVVVLTAITGPGTILAYGLAWALLPLADGRAGVADDAEARTGLRAAPPVETLAVVAVVVGAMLLVSEVLRLLPVSALVPGIIAAAGSVLVWGWGGRSRASEGSRPLLVALGVSLVVVGGLAMLALVGDLRTIGRSAAGAAVLLAGVALMLGPWLVRLGRDLTEERRQRIRSQERAEVATHLHDGVLQTLALIQKRADDGREVRSLARRQERELREWLYGRRLPDEEPATVAALLRRELADVEDRYGVRLDAVLVGDAPLDERTRALVAAGREAALNAARHAGVETVDVFLEVEPERLSLFVRDRGRGFDPAAVPPDRRGLADSVCARLRRHGGAATIRSAPGDGAEVELTMPRSERP